MRPARPSCTGTRGNLLAVVNASLTDPEAVTPGTGNTYGKLGSPCCA